MCESRVVEGFHITSEHNGTMINCVKPINSDTGGAATIFSIHRDGEFVISVPKDCNGMIIIPAGVMMAAAEMAEQILREEGYNI